MTHHAGRIVILASEDDAHIGLVKPYLRDEPLVIDFGSLSAGLSFAVLSDAPEVTITYNGERLSMGKGAVKTVWNRRTTVSRMLMHLQVDPPEEREYALSAIQNHTNSLLAFFQPEVFWVPDRQRSLRAEHKPLQLQQARLAGFNVPLTLFTSSAELAKRFVEVVGVCVIKPQSITMPPGKIQYTTVRAGASLNFSGLNVTPQIFQQLIKPDIEVRAAVVGKEVFASVVKDTEEPLVADDGVRDFRASFLKDTFEAAPFRLPRPIEEACVAYVRRMGLVCGYFDLMRDVRGVWWFIECNPNGQWGFVDDQTVDRIARALARLLEAGQSPF